MSVTWVLTAIRIGVLAGVQSPPPDPIEAVRTATVIIEVLRPQGVGTGSGFVIAADGTVVTAAHVIRGGLHIRVRAPSGEYLPVLGVRAVDARLDVAFLALAPTGILPVRVCDSDSLRVGQRLLALGSPFGLELSVADGLLSALPSRDGHRMLQISVPVSPGLSGGPVFTEDGRVVGLIVGGLRGGGAENINFALPLNDVRRQLAAALSREPMPVAHLAAVEALDFGAQEQGLASAPLSPVNQLLSVDFAQLDGVEILSRWKRDDGVEFTSLLRFGLSRGLAGETIVERLRETRVRDEGEIGHERHHTMLRVGSAAQFSTAVQFTAVAGRARDYAQSLDAREAHYLFSDANGTRRAGIAPPGVLPPALADAVVAAQTGPLPERLEFLVLDPLRERLIPVRFDFTGREHLKVPLAKPGTTCGAKPDVRPTKLEVLVGVYQMGLERRDVVVLASAPYLILEPTVKCVRLPPSAKTIAAR